MSRHPITDHDRAEIERFRDFLTSVGRPSEDGYGERLRGWIAEDPEERRRYLGLPPAGAAGEEEQP